MATPIIRGDLLRLYLIFVPLLLPLCTSHPESSLQFSIPESAPLSTLIGTIPNPPYLIIPIPTQGVESDLSINQQTGQIRTKTTLDRELRSKYTFVALPTTGENIRVSINVIDINDNSPEFPVKEVHLEFPENTPRDVKRTLPPAKDRDLGIFNTQRYVITAGNENNAFRLSSHRERDGVLYLDLQVNGFLDRETTPSYTLTIEAYDGGTPPLKSTLIVHIAITDINDNSPVFNQSKYFATISENTTVGSQVLQVYATDTDSDENARITYAIRRQTDKEIYFVVNASTGAIYLNRALDYSVKQLHELVLVAKDNGMISLETNVFVSIRVIDAVDELKLNVVYLDNGKVSEGAGLGEFVARVSIKSELVDTVRMTITGGPFSVEKRSGVWYVLTNGKLDRETIDQYELILKATGGGASKELKLNIKVTDLNDNNPSFEKSRYSADVFENVNVGTSVLSVRAIDADLDTRLKYSLVGTDEFKISDGGLITTAKSELKCGQFDFSVVAVDNGGLKGNATIGINVFNRNGPIFEFSFYNFSVKEDTNSGSCFGKVTATVPACPTLITYTITQGQGQPPLPFSISNSGQICTSGKLDYETQRLYQIPVTATQTGSLLSTTTLLLVNVLNVNDNSPSFHKAVYNFTTSTSPVVKVTANDPDPFGKITYKLLNPPSGWNVNGSGHIWYNGASSLTPGLHSLRLKAIDGGGLESVAECVVNINVMDGVSPCEGWSFEMSEDAPIGHIVGKVKGSQGYKAEGRKFKIDGDGVITTLVKFDRESSADEVLNLASSEGISCQVHITIKDFNDNAPSFSAVPMDILIPENTAYPSTIYSVQASDPDEGINAALTYSLISNYFKVDQSGNIILIRQLDYESENSYKLKIIAQDGGGLKSSVEIRVKVQDINDNWPTLGEIEEMRISENVALGSRVGEVIATDLDANDNGRVTYSMTSSFSSPFTINSSTGVIITSGDLDREKVDKYLINVTATDHGSPPLSTSAVITIKILDENDNIPAFHERSYEFSLFENNQAGSIVGKIRASDPDEGRNGQIEYRMTSGGIAVPFAIDKSGMIRTTATIDREIQGQGGVFKIQIFATDMGIPPKESSVIVTIIVKDVNDQHPMILTESELLSRVGGIEQIFAIDADEGMNGMVEFELLSPTDHGLTLDPDGTLHVQGNGPSTTMLKVRARDLGKNQLETIKEFHVKVLELNDPRSISKSWTFYVSESAAIGSKIGSIGQSLMNPIIHPTFAINSEGVITTIAKLDYESTKNYTINAESEHYKLTINILVTNVPDELPKFEKSIYKINVPESTPLNVKLMTLKAIGADTIVTYEITAQSSPEQFKIDKLNGTIYLASELDYESTKECYIQVSANANAQAQTILLITVENVNDNQPIILSPSSVNSAPVGNIVYSIIASDLDGDALTYGIEENEHFILDGRNVRVVKEGGNWFNVTVKDNKWTTRMHVTVNHVEARDDSGAGTSASAERVDHYSATVTENSLIGTEVLKFQGLQYQLPASSPPQFKISHNTLVVSAPIDREANPVFKLIAYAYLSNNQITSTSVTVKVKDLNDNAPNFQQTCVNLTVPENEELGIIHTFRATDGDSGRNGQISYTLIGGEGLFSVDLNSGELKSKNLDREKGGVYEMVVIAQDRGLPSQRKDCRFNVVVEDENDNQPEFTEQIYIASILEDAKIGTAILTVKANDADIGPNAQIKYSLQSNWLFRIDPQTGLISTAGPLDRETMEFYSFEVTATDGGLYDSRTSKAIVKITIKDSNDNQPRFKLNPIFVKHDSAIAKGQWIEKVEASDPDEGSNGEVTFSISDPSFRISTTGTVTTMNSLEQGNYELKVKASDKGTPPLTSTATIMIQIGKPSTRFNIKFQQEVYTAELKENSAQGTKVVKTQAIRTSSDGRNQKINYEIIGNDFGFGIDQQGEIWVKNSSQLDREKFEFISLSVLGKNDGGGTAHAMVNISIIDENDCAPTFNQNSYFAAVWEGNNKGTFVVQVSAVDLDSQHLTYQIVEGNQDNAFTIDPPFSGLLKTNIVLDRETLDTYKLTVIAIDEGQLTGTTTVSINVIDLNDTPPTFPPAMSLSLSESTAVGSVIMTMEANDVDAKNNLIYSLHNSEKFEIGKYSGKIWLKDAVDFEGEKKYLVTIGVSDSVHSATTELIVNISDENDHWPVFSDRDWILGVGGDTPPGSMLTRIIATDADSEANGRIRYSISPTNQISINEQTGQIYLNSTIKDTLEVMVKASDGGFPPKTTNATLWVRPAQILMFSEGSYSTEISEDAIPGTSVHQFELDNNHLHFEIVDGGQDYFSIGSSSGLLTTTRALDRESIANFTLEIQANCLNTSCLAKTTIFITIVDKNDNFPKFSQPIYTATVRESQTKVGSQLLQLSASDPDSSSNLTFDLLSCPNLTVTPGGQVLIKTGLDYEVSSNVSCVALVTDQVFWAMASIFVTILDDNEHFPYFPSAYNEIVPENSPISTPIFTPVAIDLDAGIYGQLNYTIVGGSPYFKIENGVVKTAIVFDYEAQTDYEFELLAMDFGGKKAKTKVAIKISSTDEFPPIFAAENYKFTVPANAELGYPIGKINAIDQDGGVDGVIAYTAENSNYRIETGGNLILNGPVVNGSFVVRADSGRRGSLSGSTSVAISAGPNMATNSALQIYIIIFIICLILLIALGITLNFLRKKRSSKPNKSEFAPTFDTLEYVQNNHNQEPSIYSPSEIGPPMSDHSSGRGSAEDMEDEEIAMINELPGELPAKNAQEYFARLGIRPKVQQDGQHEGSHPHVHAHAHDSWTHQHEDQPDGVDVSNLIYSSIGEENWDYLLDWGPQYQPLADVFAEIACIGGGSGGGGDNLSRVSRSTGGRSPISHDCSSGPISPSFTPALSPLSNEDVRGYMG